MLKYPNDIIRLSKQEKIRWKTLLAYLNSFNHVFNAFISLNLPIPESIKECINLNRKIRNQFLSGNKSMEELDSVVKKMLEASADMLLIFEAMWAETFPELKEIYGLTDRNQLITEIFDSFSVNKVEKIILPPIINVVMNNIQKTDDIVEINSKTFKNFSEFFNEYFFFKYKFIINETSKGRKPNHYILGNFFSTNPDENWFSEFSLAKIEQINSPQFTWFMFKLNSFAYEYSLQLAVKGSRVWEYPWMWFNILRRSNLKNKIIVDLGSELSPVPWLLALMGAKLVLIGYDQKYIPLWEELNEKLNLTVQWKIFNDKIIPLPNDSVDILTCFSVEESKFNNNKTIDEIIRILKPGGIFALSFNLYEPELRIITNKCEGKVFTIKEFLTIILVNNGFKKSLRTNNMENMQPFLELKKATQINPNYIAAAAILKNNQVVDSDLNFQEIIGKSYRENINNLNISLDIPVLFLIYNRPELTERTFEKIKEVRPTKLYIGADGPNPKKPHDIIKCNLTREIVSKIDWKCEIKTLFRKANLGCKYAVSSAINWFFEYEEAGIIVEDDILTSRDFFQFCKEMLIKYADDKRIMHITGNNLQFGWTRDSSSYYYSYYGSICGWATWKRAWKLYDLEMKNYPKFLADGYLNSLFSNEDEIQFRKSTFDEVYFKKLDTWDFQWTFSRLSNNGLSIIPNKNLIKNIGFLNNATHTKNINDIRSKLEIENMSFPLKHPKFISRDKVSDNRYFKKILKLDSEYIVKESNVLFKSEELRSLLVKSEEYIEKRDIEPARELVNIILKQDSNNIQALNDLAVIEILEENYITAKQILNKILAEDPQNETAIKNRSILEENDPLNTNQIQKILFVRTDSIGDCVLASSMLEPLRKKYNNSEIVVLCQEHIAPLFNDSPFLDTIITFNRSLLQKNDQYRINFLQNLRAYNFDLVMNSVYSPESITDLISININAKSIVGFYGDSYNIPRQRFETNRKYYTKLILTQNRSHELKHYEKFLDDLDIKHDQLKPVVWLNSDSETYANNFFNEHKLNRENTIAFFPFAQHFHKEYSLYIEVIKNYPGFNFLILGGNENISRKELIEFCSFNNCINLVGKTNISQLISIIKRAGLYLGSDSSGVHIACALNVPNVAVLGGAHFGRFLPYSSLTSAVCEPMECYGCGWKCKYDLVHCIQNIQPESLIEAIDTTLEYQNSKPRIFVQPQNINYRDILNKYIELEKYEIITLKSDILSSYGSSQTKTDINLYENQITPINLDFINTSRKFWNVEDLYEAMFHKDFYRSFDRKQKPGGKNKIMGKIC